VNDRFWRFADITSLTDVRFAPEADGPSQLLTHCGHWLRRQVRPKIHSLADLLGRLMSTINAATICIASQGERHHVARRNVRKQAEDRWGPS